MPQPPRSVFYVASAEAGTVTLYAVHHEPAARLELVQTVEVGVDVAALALHPDRSRLYASVRSAPAVAMLAVDRGTGRLHPVVDVALTMQLVSLAVDPGGRYLLGASYRDHVIVSIPLDDDGVPSAGTADVHAAGAHPHCVVPAHDGAMWATVLGDDVVLRIPLDELGRFVRDDIRVVRLPAGFGPRHLVDVPARGEIAVLGERSGEVVCIAAADGTIVRRWSTLAPEAGLAPGIVRELDRDNPDTDADGRPLTWAADIAISGAAQVVYTSERRSSVLSISAMATGEVRRTLPTEQQPRGIALDPSGRYLLVTGERAATVTLYAVDPRDGDLEPIATAAVPAGALWVEPHALPDGGADRMAALDGRRPTA